MSRSITEIAHEINRLKPDFTEFKELINKSLAETVAHIRNEQDLSIKLFKAELFIMYKHTHRQAWLSESSYEDLLLFYKNYINECTYSQNQNNYGKYWYQFQDYVLTDCFNPSIHISAHIKDPIKYLPKYIWNKVRTKSSSVVKEIKTLQPNKLALKAFENYVSKLKKMNATDAKMYFEQLKDESFKDIREDYFDVIFTKCVPSIALQKYMFEDYKGLTIPSQNSKILCKYMGLSRYLIRNTANNLNLPVLKEILDDRDSDYKPFITGIPNRPIYADIQQVAFLHSSLIILKCAVLKKPNQVYDYFIAELENYLKHPDLQPFVKDLTANYSLLKQVI